MPFSLSWIEWVNSLDHIRCYWSLRCHGPALPARGQPRGTEQSKQAIVVCGIDAHIEFCDYIYVCFFCAVPVSALSVVSYI